MKNDLSKKAKISHSSDSKDCDCVVSLQRIADDLGLSKVSVSLALNESPKISAATKKRIVAYAKKIGYVKNALLARVMSNIRSRTPNGFIETIVLLNANKLEDAHARYPIFSEYIRGIKSEATKLGYSVYEIWLHNKSLTADKLHRVLDSRGIRGGIIIGHIDDDSLPSRFGSVWNDFKFVSAGLRTSNPVLDFISADKFLIGYHAMIKIIKNGYKRPALVLDEKIDELVEGRFVGGVLRAQLQLKEDSRIVPFLAVEKARKNSKIFFDWLSAHSPDAIFSLSSKTNEWLKSVRHLIPKATELIILEDSLKNPQWIGMDKNYEMVGRLAVKKLFDLLNRPVYLRGESVPTATVIAPKWNDEACGISKKSSSKK